MARGHQRAEDRVSLQDSALAWIETMQQWTLHSTEIVYLFIFTKPENAPHKLSHDTVMTVWNI